MKKKIKVTAKQYAIISKIYRFGGFAIIMGLLASISVLVGKPFEFLFIFLPYFISKNFYEKQYHAKSLKQCFVISLMIFAAAIIFVFPAEISMTSSVIIGSGIAYISYKAGTIQDKLRDYDYIEPRYNQLVEFYQKATTQKQFDVNTCTENELRQRCERLRFGEENTGDCGGCDVCQKKKNVTLSPTLFDQIWASVKLLLQKDSLSINEMLEQLPYTQDALIEAIRYLVDEGFLREENQKYFLGKK